MINSLSFASSGLVRCNGIGATKKGYRNGGPGRILHPTKLYRYLNACQLGFWLVTSKMPAYTDSMPKRSSKTQKGPSEIARHVLDTVVQDAEPAVQSEATKTEKNPAAVALGHLGGLKGGKARAAKLTAEQRVEIARKAARKRWNKL